VVQKYANKYIGPQTLHNPQSTPADAATGQTDENVRKLSDTVPILYVCCCVLVQYKNPAARLLNLPDGT